MALRELTPANWVYADGRVFAVQRLNFNKLKAENEDFTSDLLREVMVYDSQPEACLRSGSCRDGRRGNARADQVISYRLTDVEMELVQNIDDRRDIRRRVSL